MTVQNENGNCNENGNGNCNENGHGNRNGGINQKDRARRGKQIITAAFCVLLALTMLSACKSSNAEDVTESADAASTTAAVSEAASAAAENSTTVGAQTSIEEITESLTTFDAASVMQSGTDSSPPVATVAGLKITQADFKYFLNYFKSSMLLNSGIAAGSEEERNFWQQEIGDGQKILDYAKQNTLGELENLKISISVAADRKLELDAAEIENINTTVQAQMDRYGGEAALEQIFEEEYGISIGDYRQIYAEFMLRDKLFEAEKEAIVIPDADSKAYYDANPDDYNTVTVRHILYLSDGKDAANARTPEESLQLAQDMLKRVDAGEDMKALAEEFSEDGGVALNSGEYTLKKTDAYVQEFIDWSFSHEVGETGIVETTYGYHVMKLEGKVVKSYADAKADIEDQLKEQKLNTVISGWAQDPKYELSLDQAIYDTIE